MQTYSQINEEQTEKPSILGILTSPSLQFKRLKTQRNIFLPLVVLILLIIASSALFSWNSLNNPALSMFNSGTGFSVSKKVTFLTSFGITAISGIAALFFIPIFYKNVMIFWGVDIKYKESLCIIIYSSFVLRLGMLLNGLIAFYLNGYEISYTGLGAIVTNNMILHAIAQKIDIFTIWYYILIGIGLKTFTNLNQNKLVPLIIALFIFTTALASISGFMQEITRLK
ncbi:Yip1 family protein [Bacillus cereus]|uniref:Yip1 family protein n=1 Tax=Bacillus cereus TaxID=1396 RepID=UPI000BEB8BDB|nr:Yip1 family protein [Bacillus cereus]PDY77416.1 YIP1 family protein [Bacillus cereus]PFA13190.1 YIP1 family protein [Bacillus cereus]PFM33690.1 YIP1 family protein [Bacillus cereus]